MLTLTDGARLAILGLTEPIDPKGQAGLRIATTSTSTDGRGPELGLNIATEPTPGDQIVDDAGARVFLDEAAAGLLDQQTLDVQIDVASEQVAFYLT